MSLRLSGTDFAAKLGGLGPGLKNGHFPDGACKENGRFQPPGPSPIFFSQNPPYPCYSSKHLQARGARIPEKCCAPRKVLCTETAGETAGETRSTGGSARETGAEIALAFLARPSAEMCWRILLYKFWRLLSGFSWRIFLGASPTRQDEEKQSSNRICGKSGCPKIKIRKIEKRQSPQQFPWHPPSALSFPASFPSSLFSGLGLRALSMVR